MAELDTTTRETVVVSEPAAPIAVAPQPEPKIEETPLEALASICSILVIGLFALTFIFQNFVIPSASMEKTLLIGDHVMVDRITLAPPANWAPFVHYRNVQRRDIIVFFKPGYPDLFLVKRVIGIPGDHIHLRNGIVYLNGVAQTEPYAAKSDYSNYLAYRDDFPAVPTTESSEVEPNWAEELPTVIQGDDMVVPPGHYFAMGDNRANSLDSRYWGFVPRENIVGRPLFNYWSFVTPENQEYKTSAGERVSFMTHMLVHFFDQTRWSRTLHPIR
jgi:signal peptidase I